ncbi:MAG: hypothetical protein AAGD32_14835 [Planctomycetota bacterium]
MGICQRCLLLITLVPALAVVQVDEDVKIVLNEPTVEIIEFDPANPPVDLELAPDEDALCRFDFNVDLRYKFRYRGKPTREGVTVRLNRITFTYTLDLRHRIYLPENANEKLIEHEHGHRRIGETVFAQADRIVREVADEVMGKRWEGTGKTEKEAAQAATDPMFQEALRGVVDRLTDEAQRLNDEYDDLTEHGTNGIPTDSAVKKVLLAAGYDVTE